MLTNHHTHSLYSDGYSQPEDYIKAAIDKGFTLLGFSEHSPLPFENPFSFKIARKDQYLGEINQLKQKYSHLLSLYLSMEMDYVPRMSQSFSELKSAFGLDYVIGSVHLVRPVDSDELWFTDGPDYKTYDDGLINLFAGNIRKAVTRYYHQIHEMIENEKFDIIGHFDKIKMHNRDRFFRESESWYQNLINQTLDLLKQHNIIVEVNTRGLYKKRSDTTYPGLETLIKIRQAGIPVMVNSDAHNPDDIDGEFATGFGLLKQAGIREIVYFNGKGWSAHTF
jgi:histidinol-phosphatase (PHP family)